MRLVSTSTFIMAKLTIIALLISLSISIVASSFATSVNAQNQTNNSNSINSNASGTITTTTGTTTSSPSAISSGNNKTFYVFTAEHQGLNETRLGIPADIFSPDVLIATEGDNITIHFYNLDTTARHTFTIDSPPYSMNKDLLPGQNATITFKAIQEGIFRFYCTYHQPTMAGQFIVLHPPTVEKIGPATTIR